MDEFIDVLTGVTVCLSIIYPLIYLIGFTRNSKAYKIFTIYLIGIAVVQFLLVFLKEVFHLKSTLFLFKYYFIFQFLMLSYFYKTLLGYKWIYFITSITLLFFIFQYIENPELIKKYNPLGSAIAQIIIVIYSLLYFYKLLSKKGEFLIVNIGILFYMLISTLIFAAGNLVLTKTFKGVSVVLQDLNSVFYFVFQILIILEWIKNYKKKPKLNG